MTFKVVVGGVYRVKKVDGLSLDGVRTGDLCVLRINDGSNCLGYYNPRWGNYRVWIDNSRLEFIGVFNLE